MLRGSKQMHDWEEGRNKYRPSMVRIGRENRIVPARYINILSIIIKTINIHSIKEEVSNKYILADQHVLS